MLNTQQIKLVQTAVRAAGLRHKGDDGRYQMLLAHYKVRSCKDLNNHQLDDMLAICESLGWRYPGKLETYYRDRNARLSHRASYAQVAAIDYLGDDLGWSNAQLCGMVNRMTQGKASSVVELTPHQGHIIIEALKSMLSRQTGKTYKNLKDVKHDMEVAKDGKKKAG